MSERNVRPMLTDTMAPARRPARLPVPGLHELEVHPSATKRCLKMTTRSSAGSFPKRGDAVWSLGCVIRDGSVRPEADGKLRCCGMMALAWPAPSRWYWGLHERGEPGIRLQVSSLRAMESRPGCGRTSDGWSSSICKSTVSARNFVFGRRHYTKSWEQGESFCDLIYKGKSSLPLSPHCGLFYGGEIGKGDQRTYGRDDGSSSKSACQSRWRGVEPLWVGAG
jgi:hypothetical protein